MAEELKTLIDELLDRQRLLTPVARFSQKQEEDPLPKQARYYQDLIPLSKPQKGEQYAFQVELDLCSGCKACVTACHSLNGLEEEEIWRNVGFLHAPAGEQPFQQTITTACHHCVDPGCLNGCPVDAYEKEEETGIVRHLDDQCIGCSYCVMKCPYDVPKYSEKKGIVRKCDMCHSRLSVGEAPACVQACPHEAIQIIIVDQEAIKNETKINQTIVPDAPLSNYTLPTTQYISQKGLPSHLLAADRHNLKADQAHTPLALMLVLTQASVGIVTIDFLARVIDWPISQPWSALLAILLGVAGMISATLHLGQPLKAWRFFVGLRHSWLSREILAFSLYLPLLMAYAFWLWTPEMNFLPHQLPTFLFKSTTGLILGASSVLIGLIAVMTSVMIYHDTTKPLWRWHRSGTKFYGTTILLGLAGITTCSWIGSSTLSEFQTILLAAWITTGLSKLLFEIGFFRYAKAETWSPDKRSALVQLKTLKFESGIRFFFGLLGGILIPASLLVAPQNESIFWLSLHGFLLLGSGEIIERSLFFKSVSSAKMPGTP